MVVGSSSLSEMVHPFLDTRLDLQWTHKLGVMNQAYRVHKFNMMNIKDTEEIMILRMSVEGIILRKRKERL